MTPRDIDRRNPARIAKALSSAGALYDHYFRCETEGVDHVPEHGPAILFGNHCGSTYTIEGPLLTVAIVRRYGLEHPLYYMAHRAFFDIPVLGDLLLEVGAVNADRETAVRVLGDGCQLMAFPGGDRDSHKPFAERHIVNFHGHTGFLRLSISQRVPLVPFVHVGTHEGLFVLSRGEGLAKLLNLKQRVGLNVCPITLSFPFGLSVGPYFAAIPLPTKVRMRVLPPVRLWELGYDDPNDPAQCRAALEFLTSELQRELDDLAAQRKRILLG